jgi:hypothetical protein
MLVHLIRVVGMALLGGLWPEVQWQPPSSRV